MKPHKYFKPCIHYTTIDGIEMLWYPLFDSKKTYKGANTTMNKMLKSLEKEGSTVTKAYIKEVTEVNHVLPV